MLRSDYWQSEERIAKRRRAVKLAADALPLLNAMEKEELVAFALLVKALDFITFATTEPTLETFVEKVKRSFK